MNKFEYKNLHPFKWFVLQNFPFIEADFDMITEYQLYCKVIEYLNKVIDDMNAVGQQTVDITNAMTELQNYVNNYFDNLDVQDEINNKLDEMATDGTLTNLIKNYVNPIINEFETEINETINNQNTLINNMNNKINASVGINPIAVSSINDMTDTSRIYVLETDGNWYYFDGETWQSGGVYQSTEYGENTIPSKSINNVVYDKVNNNLQVKTLTNANFTNLTGATLSEDTSSITIRRTSLSSNCQFRLNFNFDEVQYGEKIILTVSNLRCDPKINIVTSSNKVAQHLFKNGESIIMLDAEDVKSTTTLIFSLYANQFSAIADGEIFLTIDKTYKTCNSSFYDYTNVNNLSTFLNNLTKYDGITNRYNYINFEDTFQPATSFAQLIRNKNDYNYTTTANNGLRTGDITNTSSTLHIKGKVGTLSNNITIYVITYDNENHQTFNSFSYTHDQEIDLSLDLAYYSVYQNMVKFRIIVNVSNGTAILNNFIMYIDDLSDMEIYASNLANTLKNIQNKFSQIESDISQNQLVLTSPNNSKYRLVVDNEGNLSTSLISVLPTKGLFIGNSLLQGFQTHGMASYSVNDDYYYYVNEYLKTINPNFTSVKVRGGDWEASINQSQVNAFIDSYLIPNMTSDTNIVFIQLGDNCNTEEKISFIPTKAPMLIDAIKRINPNAVIYWVASWYNTSTKQNNIVNVCNTYGIKYINIAPLATDENKAYIGYEYIDANGNLQTIENSGVASHPSSIGMKKISDLIIDNL